jgi:hypothetical protein
LVVSGILTYFMCAGVGSKYADACSKSIEASAMTAQIPKYEKKILDNVMKRTGPEPWAIAGGLYRTYKDRQIHYTFKKWGCAITPTVSVNSGSIKLSFNF